MKNKIFNLSFIAVAAIAAVSCSDNDEPYASVVGIDDDAPSSLVIQVATPNTMPVFAPSADVSQTPTAQECRLTTLRVIGYPQDGSGVFFNKSMTIATNPVPVSNDWSAEMKVRGVTPGKYRIYIIGNSPLTDSETGINTESGLKAKLLTYSASDLSLLRPGALPMIYEPTGVTEILGDLPNPAAKVQAAMKLTCVKVDLNFIFDKDDAVTAASFGDYGYKITRIVASKISSKTTLVASGNKYADSFSLSPISDYGFAGQHFGAYTYTPGNATVTDRNVVENRSSAIAAPTAANNKWVYSTTLYLPERYVSSQDDMTVLDIFGQVVDASGAAVVANENHYTLRLADFNGATAADKLSLPRSTYYEVVARIESLGDIQLDTQVAIKPWDQIGISSSLAANTILTVSDTQLNVSSLEPAILTYETTAPTVTFACDSKLNSLPIITASAVSVDGKKGYKFSVNPGIAISSVPDAQREGYATVSLTANNFTKNIKVHYNIQPFFDVDPAVNTIYWGDVDTKTFTITTNLGGAAIPVASGNTMSVGQAQVYVTYAADATQPGIYYYNFQLKSDPVTTTDYNFKLKPGDAAFQTADYTRDCKQIFKPQPGNYRIYMRAINDRMGALVGGGEGSGAFDGVLAEGGTNNWIDGWNGTGGLSNERHCLYVYYQIGETSGTVPEDKVWEFEPINSDYKRRGFPGSHMIHDNNNTGWYYLDFRQDAKGKNKTSGAENRAIVPGETLVMFSNQWNTDKGYTRHRFSHHMDPGITLFDFEDREGWYLYDPTSEPYYRFYDERPDIEDVTYTVYCQGNITGWFKQYGVADNTASPSQFTIWSKSVTKTSYSGSWYKYTFTLKAPKGEYEKAIQFDIEGSTDQPMLFNGNNWTEGYYNVSTKKWYKGRP